MSSVTSLDDYRQKMQEPVAEKRMQDGFVAIPNAVEDALLASPLTHRQERVYRAILRKTLGFGKTSDCIATSQIATMTRFFEQHVRKAISDLVDMGMAVRGNRTKFGTNLYPVFDAGKWDFSAINKHTESASLSVRTNQNGADKRTESDPTTDNSTDNKTTTPCIPQVENSETATPTAKPKKSASLKTFSSWMEDVKDAGEKPIPEDDSIFEYAADAGLPIDYLRLAWVEFRDRYNSEDKRYKDWRIVFRKSVRECWMKLWYLDSGTYLLTSKGKQAMLVMKAREVQQ